VFIRVHSWFIVVLAVLLLAGGTARGLTGASTIDYTLDFSVTPDCEQLVEITVSNPDLGVLVIDVMFNADLLEFVPGSEDLTNNRIIVGSPSFFEQATGTVRFSAALWSSGPPVAVGVGNDVLYSFKLRGINYGQSALDITVQQATRTNALEDSPIQDIDGSVNVTGPLGPIVFTPPPGGVFSPPLEITISSDQSSAIHYTTDGSDPDTNSPTLPNPFTTGYQGETELTVKALAVDDNGCGRRATVLYNFDQVQPTVAIIDVDPDPRATPVPTIVFDFSEPVTGFEVADLSLTRNGGNELLTGQESLTPINEEDRILSDLGPLTNVDGTYTLTLLVAGSGITDISGNPLAGDVVESWTLDRAPTGTITPVGPDPRNQSVDEITIVFSEPVEGFGPEDLILERNGVRENLLTGGETLVSNDGDITWTLGNLDDITVDDGTYTLTLTAEDSNIVDKDLTPDPLVAGATESWEMDTEAPTVEIQAVQPDPRNLPVATITIAFSKPVNDFGKEDLTLSREDAREDLPLNGTTLNISDGGQTWELAGLDTLTGAEATYTLTLTAAGSGIQGFAGNDLNAGDTESWVMDTTEPAVEIVEVQPDPRNAPVDSITFEFSEPVVEFGTEDLTLDRDGGDDLLTVTQRLTTGDDRNWTLTELSDLTGEDGPYRLSLTRDGSQITDFAGNTLSNDSLETWIMDARGPVITDTLAPQDLILGLNDDAPNLLDGITVFDVVDGEIQLQPENVTGDVDTQTLGPHLVSYDVVDSFGNVAETLTRTYQAGFRQTGTINYEGTQAGIMYIEVFDNAEFDGGPAVQSTLDSGRGDGYVAILLIAPGTYWLRVFIDPDGSANAAFDAGEPVDQFTHLGVLIDDNRDGIDFFLSDWDRELALAAGWNPISFPGPLLAAEAAQLQLLTVGEIWGWDGIAYAAASQFDGKLGYWIYVAAAQAVSLRGINAAEIRTVLATGWNMAGVCTDAANPRTVDANVEYAVWRRLDRRFEKVRSDGVLAPFEVYWIEARNPTSIPAD